MIKKALGFLWLISMVVFSLNGCGTVQKKNGNIHGSNLPPGWTMAMGVGSIRNGLIGKAKDDALQDAKRNAVQQVLGSYLSSRTDIKDGEFLGSEISSKAEGFIETYEIVKAGAVSAIEYQVSIKAKVNRAKIEKTIEDVLASMGKPVMIAIINEKLDGQKNISRQTIAGTEIESQLIDKGFSFVDKSTVERILQQERNTIASALQGNLQSAASLGWNAKAEIILIGEAVVKNAGMIEGVEMFSMQADVSVRAVDVNTGQVLASYQEHAASPHINKRSGATKAIQIAVKKITQKIVDRLMKAWDPNKGKTVNLLVLGLNYEQLRKFDDQLKSRVRGVKAVNRKGTEGKFAKLHVEFLGKSYDLLDRILDAGLDFRIQPGNSTRPGYFILNVSAQ